MTQPHDPFSRSPPTDNTRTGDVLEPLDPLGTALAAGTMVGSYRTVQVIAMGGFGTVYEVEQVAQGTRAALKLLHQSLLANAANVARFLREVEVVQRIAHPNVIKILDVGWMATPEAVPFFVMELLHGNDLSRHMHTHNRLTPEDACEIIEAIASALTTAHGYGIVHRDIKASNIFLDDTAGMRRIVLLDFGVAKLSDPSASDLTTSGQRLGTPVAMAPEQILGKPVDARTDVYALGLLSFHMLTGKVPFLADAASARPLALHAMHLGARRPRPSEIANTHLAFDPVIARAMSINPTERYPSAAEYAAAFRQALAASQIGPSTSERVTTALCVAAHLEIHLPVDALDDQDESLLVDLDAVMFVGAAELTGLGFRTAFKTATSVLGVKPYQDPSELRQTVAGLQRLWAQLAARDRRDSRVHVDMAVHVGEALVQDDKVHGGPLLKVATWVPREQSDDLHLTDEVKVAMA